MEGSHTCSSYDLELIKKSSVSPSRHRQSNGPVRHSVNQVMLLPSSHVREAQSQASITDTWMIGVIDIDRNNCHRLRTQHTKNTNRRIALWKIVMARQGTAAEGIVIRMDPGNRKGRTT